MKPYGGLVVAVCGGDLSGGHAAGSRGGAGELDLLIQQGRAGTSGPIVLRGEPGIGKTALLSYAGERAGSMRILRATGIESEGELAFGGLYSPVLSLADRLDAQPGRYAALRAALGLRGGTVAAGAARMLHSETGGNPGRNGGIRHADRRQR